MDPTNWWMQQSNPTFGQGGGVPPPMFSGMPMGSQTSMQPQAPPMPAAAPQAAIGGMFGGSGITQSPALPQSATGAMSPPNPQRDQIVQSLMQQPGYGSF